MLHPSACSISVLTGPDRREPRAIVPGPTPGVGDTFFFEDASFYIEYNYFAPGPKNTLSGLAYYYKVRLRTLVIQYQQVAFDKTV